MKVKDFYQCPKMLTENNVSKYPVLYDCLHQLYIDLKNEPQSALGNASKFLTDNITDDMFSFPWQRDAEVKDDISKLARFINWLGSDTEVIDYEVPITLTTQRNTLQETVPLIVRYASGTVGALFVFFKCSDKSAYGKSVHTATGTDLFLLTAKAALEKEYPGIVPTLVYLSSPDDSAGDVAPQMNESGRRGGNIFPVAYKSYYEDDCFQLATFLNLIDTVVSTPVKPDCFNCPCKQLCGTGTISTVQAGARKEEVKPYTLPEYTDDQLKVISHKDGPMLVCAGPGSGKTATLVGRVKALEDAGVPAEFILCITFTTDAAEELSKRCGDVCEMPIVSTLNAFGYKLLQKNASKVGSVKLLTQYARYDIIANLLSIAPVKGIKCGMVTGSTGAIATLDRYLQAFSSSDRDSFMQEHPDLGDDFIRFYKEYTRIVKANGYISFDEQITLCLDLFRQEPDVLKAVSRRYKYVMVDEYQDIDAYQQQLIYAVASHGNLVVVGDDDQSIYGFRGGSNKYMLQFSKDFASVETVVLRDNFRSTGAIVDASKAVISANKERIEKPVRAVRGGGIAPQIIDGQGVQELEEVIGKVLSEGYHYSDIAVAATKNATLETLSKDCHVPVVLGHPFLVKSPLFILVRCLLEIDLNISDKRSEYELMLGKPDDGFIKESERYLSESPEMFCDVVAGHFGLDGSADLIALDKVVEDRHLRDLPSLQKAMEYMAEYNDDTRIIPDIGERVLFTTAHESKGQEWPVVILLDDFRYDGSESSRRLYYVAMTRAKDRLYVLRNGGQKTLMEKEA